MVQLECSTSWKTNNFVGWSHLEGQRWDRRSAAAKARRVDRGQVRRRLHEQAQAKGKASVEGKQPSLKPVVEDEEETEESPTSPAAARPAQAEAAASMTKEEEAAATPPEAEVDEKKDPEKGTAASAPTDARKEEPREPDTEAAPAETPPDAPSEPVQAKAVEAAPAAEPPNVKMEADDAAESPLVKEAVGDDMPPGLENPQSPEGEVKDEPAAAVEAAVESEAPPAANCDEVAAHKDSEAAQAATTSLCH